MSLSQALSSTMALLISGQILLYALGCGDDQRRVPGKEAIATVAPTSTPQASIVLSDAEQRSLELLGYINMVPVLEPDREKSGVTVYDPERAFAGLNLFNARHESIARLIDMNGVVLHRWQSSARGATFEAFQRLSPAAMPAYLNGWNHVELLPDGGILAIGSHHSLLRLDRDSKLQWKLDLSVHHDVSIGPNGNFYVLVDDIRSVSANGRAVAFQDNLIQVISPSGKTLHNYSLYEGISDTSWERLLDLPLQRVAKASRGRLMHYRESAENGGAPEHELARLYAEAIAGDDREHAGMKNVLFHNSVEDIFHTNSVQVLKRGEPGLWRKGDLLISILRFDMIGVLDQDSGKLIWSWGERELQKAHHARQLDNGEIQIFDNGSKRGYSRILRLAPASRQIVWRYRADPPGDFFSKRRGGCQALPNGNLLIANTDSGQAFEVDPQGRVVWEYFTEIVETPGGERKRGAIYRMTRFAPEEVAPWLDLVAHPPSSPM